MDFSAPSSLEVSPVALPRSASSPRPSRRGVFSLATVISLRSSFDQLLRDIHVGLCSYRRNIVENDRLSETWRLGQADISWDDVLEHLRPEVLSRVFRNLSREI